MNEKASTKTAKNYLYSTAYSVLQIILPFITSPYLSRHLGPDMIGANSYVFSIASYFVLFIMFGVTYHGNRSVAKARNNQSELFSTFWSIYLFQIFRCILVAVAYIVYVVVFSKEYVALASIYFILIVASGVDITWALNGLELFKATVLKNIIVRLLCTLSIFVFIKDSGDVWKYALITALTTLVSNASLWLYLKKLIPFSKPTSKEILYHFKPELLLFVPVLAISIYRIMDKIMLGAMCNDAQVGFYSLSENIVNMPYALISSLGTVMLPRVTNLLAKGKKETAVELFGLSINFVTALGFALMFGLCAVSSDFSIIYFGDDFAACGLLIAIMSLALPYMAWGNITRMQVLLPLERDKKYTVSIILGAGVNLIANLVLIPYYDAMGAAVGTVLAEAVVCLWQLFSVRDVIKIRTLIKENIYFLIAGCAMFLSVLCVGRLLSFGILRLIIQIIIGVIVYMAFMLLYLAKSQSNLSKYMRGMLISK